MAKSIYHVHHIVPRHAGGSDDPSNLIRLTVEDHALAHKKLWEENGMTADKVAWLMLSGQVATGTEALHELYREAGKMSKGRKHSQEAKNKMSNVKKSKHTKRPDLVAYNTARRGKPHSPKSEEHKAKIRAANLAFYQTPEGIAKKEKASKRMKLRNPGDAGRQSRYKLFTSSTSI